MSPKFVLVILDVMQPRALPPFPFVYQTLVNGPW